VHYAVSSVNTAISLITAAIVVCLCWRRRKPVVTADALSSSSYST